MAEKKAAKKTNKKSTQQKMRDSANAKMLEAVERTRARKDGVEIERAGNSSLSDAPKKKNKGFDPAGDKWLSTQPGDNARYIRMALVPFKLPPIDISDPKQVEQRITDYFMFCVDNDARPSVVGMANWLGVHRDTLNQWKRGEYRTSSHTDLIQKAMGVLEQLWSEYMQNGKINPVSGIFMGKVFFGYRETTEHIITPGVPTYESTDELVKAAGMLPDGDGE